MKVQDIDIAARDPAGVSELVLRNMDVKALPALLPLMPGLHVLHIENCGLRRLPESIGGCALLDTLILDRNRLDSLPASLGRCTRLFRLSVSYNRLAALPESLAECINLRQVDVSHNRLEAWPERLARLPWLARLDLSDNRLSSILYNKGVFPQLRYLDISGNALISLPDALVLPRLETLLLAGNRLAGLPGIEILLPALEKFDLSKNPLASLPPLPAKLKSLNIGNCLFPGLPEALFAAVELRELRGLRRGAGPKLLRFLGACRRKPVPLALRPTLFAAYCGEEEPLSALSQEECTQAFQLALPVLQECIARHLTHRGLPLPGKPEQTAPLQSALSPEQAGQLRRLLVMPAEGNAALAARIIRASGLPPGLHTELLYAWMQSPPGALKTELRRLLENCISHADRRILRLPLKAWAARDPGQLETRLAKAFQHSVFDPEKLYRLMIDEEGF